MLAEVKQGGVIFHHGATPVQNASKFIRFSSALFTRELWPIALLPLVGGFVAISHRPLGGSKVNKSAKTDPD
jgi:hypothetical protein